MLTLLTMPFAIQTPQGKAWAVATIDNGLEADRAWVTFVHDSGECRVFSNSEISRKKKPKLRLCKPAPDSD